MKLLTALWRLASNPSSTRQSRSNAQSLKTASRSHKRINPGRSFGLDGNARLAIKWRFRPRDAHALAAMAWLLSASGPYKRTTGEGDCFVERDHDVTIC